MVGFFKSESRKDKNTVSCLFMLMGNLLLKLNAISFHETLSIFYKHRENSFLTFIFIYLG